MVLTADDGTILNLNYQAECLFGYTLAEVADWSVDHLVPERLRDRLRDHRRAFE